MFEKFTNKFLTNLLTYGFSSLFLGVPILIYWLLTEYLWVGVVAFGVFLFFVAYGSFKDIFKAEDKAHKAEVSRIQSEAQQQEKR